MNYNIYKNYSRVKLLDLCKKYDIKGCYKLKKQELVEYISENIYKEKDDLNRYTLKDLKEMAYNKGIKNINKLRKNELIDVLNNDNNEMYKVKPKIDTFRKKNTNPKDKNDLYAYTVVELRKIAKSRDLKYYIKLNKEDLVNLLLL